jgi:hypothetical protein
MTDTGNEGMEGRVASITVDRPQAGESLTVAVSPGLRVVLDFNPAAAKFGVEGDDFILTLEDGARIVFEGLISAAQGGDAPSIEVAGIDIDAGMLMEQVLALATEAEADPIETAAGEDGEEGEVSDGGGSHYEDSFGDLIAGLIKQGIIDETDLGFGLTGSAGTEIQVDADDLGFGLTGSAGTEIQVDADDLSEGYLSSADGFFIHEFDPASVTPAMSPPPGASGGPDFSPGETPASGDVGGGDIGGGDIGGGDIGGGDIGGDGAPDPLSLNGINLITNEANGNLQIPDELILYLTDGNQGAGLSVAGPSYDGAADNAYIWDAGGAAPGSANTWTDHAGDHVKFHINGGHPAYEGNFTYQMSDGSGATGQAAIHVENFATGKAGSYWTLDGTGADEVLLGLDGRNQIDGGGGNDIIHGGHDSSGDILIGGDGNDVIFGGSGNDDLQGGNGDDTFIMRAGFGRDDVDGGAGNDIISLNSVLAGAEVADNAAIDSWLTLNGVGTSYIHDAATDTIPFQGGGVYSGTIDLGGGNEITFLDIEQIVYTDLV